MASIQGARLQSPGAELTVLRALLSKDKVVSGTMLGLVDESYFYDDESLEVFHSIKSKLTEDGEAPSYNTVIRDPELSKAARDHLKTSQATVTTAKEAREAARALNLYRQRRMLYEATATAHKAFQNPKLGGETLKEVVLSLQQSLVDLQARKSTSKSFVHAGTKSNTKDYVHDILFGNRSDDLIKTGLQGFDDIAGGWLRGALVTVGSTSGGGKSTVTMAVGMKQAEMGYKVLMVPLEMTKVEMLMRMMANASGVNLTKIVKQDLTEEEKEMITRKFRRWERRVEKAGGVFHIFEPEEDMTIEEIMSATSTYEVDIKIIDYATLLKGADGEDQWRALGKIARYCKVHAKSTNCVVVLIVQIDESGKIRYSRAMNEHSSYSWVWVATAENKQDGVMTIEQPKSRFSESKPFTIRIIYATMRVEDVRFDDEERSDAGGLDGGEGRKTQKAKSNTDGKVKPMENLVADIS
jgi:replicative DNA helicase